MKHVALAALSTLTLLAQDSPKSHAREERRQQRPPLAEQFGYKETSRVNGGAAVVYAVASNGHQYARVGPERGEVVDIDKETVTTIDYGKKEYSVATFADLKKSQPRLKTSVTKTGKQKEINFFNVYEAIIKVESGAQTLSADVWMVPGISGFENIQKFQALGLPPGQGPLMAELFKETSKLVGIPMQQTITITGSGKPVEITTDLSAYSGAPNPPSKFAVPSGFKQVQPKRP